MGAIGQEKRRTNPQERSAVTLGLPSLVGNQSSFPLRTRTGQVHDQIKYSSQDETKDECTEKQFRLSVKEEEETQRKTK
jgi:hypothetical protein